MMKKVTIYIALFFGLAGWSQQKRIVLDWGYSTPQTKSTVVSRTTEKPLESTARFSAEENTYIEVWQDQSFATSGSARISNVSYETLSAVAYSSLDQNLLPNTINFKLSSSRARDQILTTLEFTPIVNDNGVIKKVKAFDLSYTSGGQSESQRNIGLTNSVLASGRWYQFQIDKTGAYRIDRNFLNSIGMDVNNIDPRNIKIYSHGGNMLPYLNSHNTDFDPPEIPIQVIGEADGVFDGNDYILFYGETQQYSEESDTHINLYDNNTYYYITADGGPGKRIPGYTEPLGNADLTISRFHDYQFHEVDDFNPGLVGRR